MFSSSIIILKKPLLHLTVFPSLAIVSLCGDFNKFQANFNICCPRDCVSRHNGGTSGAPLKPFGVDSALRTLSTLRGLRGAPEVPPLCRETQSLGQPMLNAPLGINGLRCSPSDIKTDTVCLQPRHCEKYINQLLISQTLHNRFSS